MIRRHAPLLAFLAMFALLRFAPEAIAAPMEFRLVPFGDPARCGVKCPKVISAEGEITSQTPKDFLAFVARNLDDDTLRSVVFLHSPGGSVAASMQLGQMFRSTRVMAIVGRIAPAPPGAGPAIAIPGGRCYSACVYALMGGKKRVVPPNSLVGIHRMFFNEYGRDAITGEDAPHRVLGSKDFVAKLADYANAMGVSRDAVWTAETISPDSLHIVTPQELRRWRLGSPK